MPKFRWNADEEAAAKRLATKTSDGHPQGSLLKSIPIQGWFAVKGYLPLSDTHYDGLLVDQLIDDDHYEVVDSFDKYFARSVGLKKDSLLTPDVLNELFSEACSLAHGWGRHQLSDEPLGKPWTAEQIDCVIQFILNLFMAAHRKINDEIAAANRPPPLDEEEWDACIEPTNEIQ